MSVGDPDLCRLQYHSSGPHDWTQIDAVYETLFRQLKALGLSSHPGSRFSKQREMFRRLCTQDGRLGDQGADDVLAAMSDLFQMLAITGVATRRQQTDTEFRKKFNRSVNGNHKADYSPQAKNQDRDIQFELFVLSSLKDDLRPQLIPGEGKPDIKIDRLSVAIEAKRPKSIGSLLSKFKEGAVQVTGVAKTGSVATDLTAIFASECPISIASRAEAGAHLATKLYRFQQEYVQKLHVRDNALVWSAYATTTFVVDNTLFGPIGLWGHIETDGRNVSATEAVKEAFAPPQAYSFL